MDKRGLVAYLIQKPLTRGGSSGIMYMQDSETVIAPVTVSNRSQCNVSIISTETDTDTKTNTDDIHLVSVNVIGAYRIRLSMSVLKNKFPERQSHSEADPEFHRPGYQSYGGSNLLFGPFTNADPAQNVLNFTQFLRNFGKIVCWRHEPRNGLNKDPVIGQGNLPSLKPNLIRDNFMLLGSSAKGITIRGHPSGCVASPPQVIFWSPTLMLSINPLLSLLSNSQLKD